MSERVLFSPPPFSSLLQHISQLGAKQISETDSLNKSQLWSQVLGTGCLQGWFLGGLSPWLADGCLLAVSSPGIFSACASLVSLCVPKFPFLIRTPVKLD